MKIAVLTDSTSYLSQTLIDKYNIKVAPLSVTFDSGENFVENATISTDEFYKRMKTSNTIPTTSQPAIGDFLDKFEQLSEEGYTDVICVFLSGGISGCYQTATQAGEMVEDINVHTFDSKLAAMVEGAYVLKAIEMIEQNFEPQAIIEELYAMREDTGAVLMVDDLKNLQKSGRITGAQAWIGTMLKMKPVLKFDDGKIVPDEKVRTKKRALRKMIDKVIAEVKEFEEVTLFVIEGDIAEDSDWIQNELEENYAQYPVYRSSFGPVIAAHLGSGGIGLGYVGRTIRTK
ncbi:MULTISPECIES: fatty acid kinase binding subunit FakB1 [Staphylococcus]|uniref:DegV family protein n=1 Tax=Staphylococcus shinii TaxID=2912228 RepID=A0A418IJH4_9STAP|nr:fatty acid kinase binding subunit FakB1 [Staphylococcus shinii]MBO3066011.1 fatty acid kinase binding subunit FakB1 [Staphylococcus shinii]MDW8564265.1 fatty acid kinase binding subunit FakB1 [Staphylococcus shinii]MDW8567492.1 fatty acid kinase binding subunit FakB1 [Staphylococcus shinii]MDW8570430.1 fatty acid kinase binding subunit FakB1 [Staphylococcus shinii]MDW8573664.1 fatty acid kinase binding subunit FakB1 [Staphylococcus shinii]